MKVLITGSTGFIGSRLVSELKRREISFRILARSTQPAPLTKRPDAEEVSWPEGISGMDLSSYSAVIHLAAAPTTQRASLKELRRNNVEPIERFLKRISETNPLCRFVFVSSQSSRLNAESTYGRLKWEADQILRGYEGSWVIVRPGLVVGPGGQGLFNRMLSVVKKCPVVPLIGSGDYLLQPIDLDSVVEALVKVSTGGPEYDRQEFALVGPAITFRALLQESATALGKKRLFIPIPTFVIAFGLAILERCVQTPPVTRTNLLGVMQLELMNGNPAHSALGIQLPPLSETLRKLMQTTSTLSPLEVEAQKLHQALFDLAPSPTLVRRYIEAHRHCCFDAGGLNGATVYQLCQKGVDLEAIEYALRSRNTLLSKKMLLMLYLAEQEHQSYSCFVNQSPRGIVSFAALARAVLRAPWKLIKGKYLAWRHDLV